MNNRYLPLLIFAFLNAIVHAQVIPQDVNLSQIWEAGLPFITHYSAEDYRAHVQNWCFVQDANGIMYMGNTSGVLQFDGSEWHLLKLPNGSPAKSLAKTDDGTIYVGAVRDLGFLQPDPAGRIQFHSLLSKLDTLYRDFADIWFTYADGQTIYFISDRYIFRWSGNKFTVWKAEQGFGFAGLVHDKLYVDNMGKGIMVLQNDSLTLIPDGDRFLKKEHSLTTFLPYGNDKMLVGHYQEGLFLYDHHSFIPFGKQGKAALQEKNIYCGQVLQDGKFLFATQGGGMFNSGANSIQLDQVEFSDNYSNYGGGMANVEICSPIVRNTVFNGNSGEYGGGMCNGDCSNPILTNVNFLGNNAFIGGGMVNFTGSSPQCRNILFQGNAADYGGGMHNQSNCSPELINVIFSRNLSTAIHSEGGGIYNNAESSPKLVNVTFNGNIASYRGGAIFNVSSSSPTLINTIIWNNQCDSCGSSSQSSIVNLDSLSVPVISYSLIGGSGGSGTAWESELGIDGSHNIDSDPMFVYAVPVGTAATMADDLHLQVTSPGINSGDPATNPSFFVFEGQNIPLDLDGNQRVQGGKIDLGPYESGVVNSLEGSQMRQNPSVELRNNFPNPFSDYTTIAYQIPSPGYVLLKIYDTQGKLIAVPVNETVLGGYHELRIYTDGWKPGVYFYSLQVEGYTATRQMILLK